MNYCEVKSFEKSQTLHKMSSLPETFVYQFIKNFESANGRFPELDEIPNADSESYLYKQLNIHDAGKSKYISIQNILKMTNSISISEAIPKLNKEYSDLQIDLVPLGDAALIDIKHRPQENDPVERDINYDSTTESNTILIEDALNRLQKFYGIEIIPVTTQQLVNNPQFKNLPIFQTEAFIFNGNIYVNTDVATVDAPIHEQLHLFLGSIRYNNPNLYFSLVNQTEQLPGFENLIKAYPNRTMSDIKEEIFVTELAKYVTHRPSLFDSIDSKIINYVMYNINRDIDSIVFGRVSVKSLDNPFEFSLLQLASKLDSDNFDLDSIGTLNDATIHRIMANTKEELMKNNSLTETCI